MCSTNYFIFINSVKSRDLKITVNPETRQINLFPFTLTTHVDIQPLSPKINNGIYRYLSTPVYNKLCSSMGYFL